MARTAQKVDDLAAEGESMVDALKEVLAVAEEEGTVTWSDVSDDITSGEWGRLIETGLLVDAGGDGFVIDDPEGIHDALDDTDPDSDSDGDGSWTKYDKAAAVGVLALFAGYSLSSVRAEVATVIDLFMGPLYDALPFYVVVLILALLTGLFTTILQDNLMDSNVMGDYQEQNKRLKEKRERAKEQDDDELMEEVREEQMELMSENMGMFKAQFRPMVWIMLLTIPVFLWLYWMVLDVGVTVTGSAMVLPIFGDVGTWQTKVLGPIQLWLIWYFLCSMGFNQILRKALNVQTSPT
ncbi:DUF106 domain-containing protein [Salinibaculum rarum]|uniref:DUF106 domain-containing protein n=1 Tax=Salinibaculum rarum TaxID=3058903 RepID=UPI00265F416A|nr:DUF106 domain-containing protein [Salinibaculum sp. KK48]